MQRPFITDLISNLKSPTGGLWATKLGRHTLIMGPSRSHKTTIIQAAELAATGMVDDVAGRDEVKQGAMLMSLAADDNLRASVTYSDGTEAGYYLEPGSKPTSQNLHAVALHRTVRGLLAGSGEKLQAAMLGWLDLTQMPESDVLESIPGKFWARYRDIADRMRKTCANEAEVLLAIIEYAGKSQREMSANRRAAEAIETFLKAELGSAGEDPSDVLHEMLSLNGGPITNMQRVLEWAVTSGISQCPTCGTGVGDDHIKACHTHMATQKDADNGFGEVLLRFVEATKARASWTQAQAIATKAGDFAEREGEYKDLKKACVTAVDILVKKGAADLVKSVNRYLPDTWALGYDVERKQLGLDQGARGIFTSVSGSEWATMTVAIACAAAERVDDSIPLLLVVPDRAFDSKTLAATMRGLAKFNGQVLVQSTVKPRGRVSSSWTILSSEDFVQSIVAPGRPKAAVKINETTVRMMEALGYNDDMLQSMSPETLQSLAHQGLPAANVAIGSDGSWSLKNGGNLVIIPQAK